MDNKLSNEELSSYLQEINAKEAAELPQDLQGDKAWKPEPKLDGKGGVEMGAITASEEKERRSEKQAKRKEARREIVNSIINDKNIDLTTLISVEQKKWLIAHNAKKYSDLMAANANSIKTFLTRFVYNRLPILVRRCWEYYPKAMIPQTPYEYQASEDFGEGYTYTLEIDVPMYFSWKEIIKKINDSPKTAICIDKSISKFYKYKQARELNEVRQANMLLSINTYYDLLNKDPFSLKDLIDYENNKQC